MTDEEKLNNIRRYCEGQIEQYECILKSLARIHETDIMNLAPLGTELQQRVKEFEYILAMTR